MTEELKLEYTKIWKDNNIKCPLKMWLEFVEELISTSSCKKVKFPDNKFHSDPV